MSPRVETIGDCTLYLGDALEILPTLGRFDACITDPPYGISANRMTLGKGKKDFDRGGAWDDERPDITILPSICDAFCVWGGNYFADVLPPTNDILVWHKMNDGRSFSECEFAWTNFGKQSRLKSHHWGGEEKKHPTQKPLEVMKWTLGHLPGPCSVIDPFMGSGTTGVACALLGFTFAGIEREPSYFDIACRRIEEAYRQPRLFAEPKPKPTQEALL
jgi:DNA modification methylase